MNNRAYYSLLFRTPSPGKETVLEGCLDLIRSTRWYCRADTAVEGFGGRHGRSGDLEGFPQRGEIGWNSNREGEIAWGLLQPVARDHRYDHVARMNQPILG